MSTMAVRKTGEATKNSVRMDSSLSSHVFIFTALMTPTGTAMTMDSTPLRTTRPRVTPMRWEMREPTSWRYW